LKRRHATLWSMMIRSRLQRAAGLAATLSATAAMAPTGTATAAPEPVSFTTPSGNIACMMSAAVADIAASVRCDIGSFAYTPPPAPPDCHVVFGHTLLLEQGHPPQFECAHDTMVLSHFPVVGYGDFVQEGPLRCDSTAGGVVCTDNTTRRSFRLSRKSYGLT
jgi:hypothetical protein